MDAKTTPETIETPLSGKQLLADSYLNKGTAFPEDEREAFGLLGLVPLHASTIEEQLRRTYGNFKAQSSPIEKYIFLSSLQQRNEILFYRLLQEHIPEMVPIIYTPTVGEACQRYSHVFRASRGLYLSYPDKHPIDALLETAAPKDVDVIVVTDGQRVLGLGDLGIGGMGIPIGKLALYTLCAGIDPRRTLPVLLDVGTNNEELLNDPLYLGWRHKRPARQDYDHFVDRFIKAVHRRWPHAIIQWEDFAKENAYRLLQRHQTDHPCFNDDIQGTAAVAVAGLLRACRIQGTELKDQRIMIAGAGSAATGIGQLLIEALHEQGLDQRDARSLLWLVDTRGLVHAGRKDLSEEKNNFAQSAAAVSALNLKPEQPISLLAAVRALKPTVLLGTSGHPKFFDEELVKALAAGVERPIIFPLSNPNSKSEADPEDLIRWTNGRCRVATGSPYEPVSWNGQTIAIGQCNNVFIFPGVGLGLTVAGAKSVPNDVFLTAAKTLAAFETRSAGFETSLFPNMENVREVSREIAIAVARHIVRKGLSRHDLREDQVAGRVAEAMWEPVYPKLRRIAT